MQKIQGKLIDCVENNETTTMVISTGKKQLEQVKIPTKDILFPRLSEYIGGNITIWLGEGTIYEIFVEWQRREMLVWKVSTSNQQNISSVDPEIINKKVESLLNELITQIAPMDSAFQEAVGVSPEHLSDNQITDMLYWAFRNGGPTLKRKVLELGKFFPYYLMDIRFEISKAKPSTGSTRKNFVSSGFIGTCEDLVTQIGKSVRAHKNAWRSQDVENRLARRY